MFLRHAAAWEAALRSAGHTPEAHHYRAQHGFFNDTRPEVFDAASAELAWARSLAFLRGMTRH